MNKHCTTCQAILDKIKHPGEVLANGSFWQIQYLNSLVIKLLEGKINIHAAFNECAKRDDLWWGGGGGAGEVIAKGK